MTTAQFRELLDKWRKGIITPDEEILLRDVLGNPQQDLKNLMVAELESFSVPQRNDRVDFDSLLQQVKRRISTEIIPEQRGNRVLGFSRVAAIFIIALLTGGVLSYLWFKPAAQKQISDFIVKAPLGGRSEVTLPDGSHVWLNAGSSLRYNDGFNKQNRTLHLEGEAYFKVAKNKDLPLVVKTSEININAVGTEFNVKAYAGDNLIETTLIEGVVTLEKKNTTGDKNGKVYLEPNQKAVYVKHSGNLKVNPLKKLIAPQQLKPVSVEKDMFVGKKIDPLPDIAWKENKLIFKSTELEDMAITLERKYNIAIRFGSDKVKKIRFTGTLQDETLQQVLDVIKLTSPIDYSLTGKEVTINENPNAQKEFLKHLKRNNY